MTLIIGLPNAGKTTYSQRYTNVLHLDDFPWNRWLNCNEAVRQSDGNVVVEGIYNLRCRRERLLEAVAGKNVRNVCIWLDTPQDECLRREDRGRDARTITDIFQPPTLDEGWDEIIRITGNSNGNES